MRALLQRVSRAAVDIGERRVGEIGPGLLILVCAMRGDTEGEAAALARKIAKLRIFGDEDGRMNRSVLDTGGGVLAVSQFTLGADTTTCLDYSASAAEVQDAIYALDSVNATNVRKVYVEVNTREDADAVYSYND
ncbi:MAG: D-tyrosyl-tRNA(Tyr) deacylase, partial [Rhodospirillaceae bacterium]|nr:D-tyrosyl-tRNA(Tyr) deacylase [Rhodospirillaceae bacterium]